MSCMNIGTLKAYDILMFIVFRNAILNTVNVMRIRALPSFKPLSFKKKHVHYFVANIYSYIVKYMQKQNI